MIKGNKKIAKILAVAMCAGVFADAGVAGYVNSYADDSVITADEETVEEEEVSSYDDSVNTVWEYGEKFDPETNTYKPTATAISNNIKIASLCNFTRDVNIIGYVSCAELPDTIPTTLYVGGVPYNVLNINENAFVLCKAFKNLKIPGKIENIGNFAFGGTSCETIDIEEGVKSIGYGAFTACTSLKSINIPDSITSFGEHVFDNCNSDLVINVKSERVRDLVIASGAKADNINLSSSNN